MMLEERGVVYSREVESRHDWRFQYIATYTPTGEQFTHEVFIRGMNATHAELGFYKLLDYWNRCDNWRYWAKLS